MARNSLINQVFEILYDEYGPQHWWPARTPFEVCVGAILTQNTSWKNVEKAILQMKKEGLLNCNEIVSCSVEKLENAIHSSGFYKQKAQRLKLFCEKVNFNRIKSMEVMEARKYLLSINGIGKETADSMLLYAFNKPIFVVDAYTKRIYSRLTGEYIQDYDALREIFEDSLGKSVKKYNEMHALLVEHAKVYCTKNNPGCEKCPLSKICQSSQL